MTPELEAEGLARDVIRAVQETRKNADFDVSDRIRLDLVFASDQDADAVASAFDEANIAGETLATEHGLHRSGDIVRDAEFTATIPADTYANRGDFTIAVSRIGASA
jgi:isoleucyl-tRNA synthetase